MKSLRDKMRTLDVENVTLKSSVQEACSSEETMEKAVEILTKRLQEEESKRKELSTQFTQTIQTKATENLNLLKEMESLKTSLENEKNCRGELEQKLAQLNQVISLGQQALKQERTAVELLKKSVAKLRDLSPLWDMYKDGIDLNSVQWAAH